MVFESIVTDVLNRSLGEYVENLDSSQLKIGIWGGDVVLKNLVLKQNALDDLNLPVKVVYGILGKLVLKIPWKNLYSAPTEASVERLFLLVVPNQEIKYDAEKEEKWKQEAKKEEIEKVEAAKKREKEKDQPKADDTFAEKLVAQIVRNVQISIKDIHIRYEDKVSNPKSPFALGITLRNLAVITTDNNWEPAISQTGHIYKHLKIEGLSVYWNSNCNLFGFSSKENILNEQFQNGIPSKNQLIEGYKYMFGPLNCEAKLQLNMKPELDDYKIPKVLLTLQIDKVFVSISKSQYSDVIALLDSLDRMSRASLYRKYRPNVNQYKGNYKAWWVYAYTCILEEEVRRKRKNWDWLHIVQHRQLCRNYADAYRTKLMNGSKQDITLISRCESELDSFNIVLIRQKIEVEVQRAGERASLDSKSQKGWFSSWWGGSKEVEDSKLDIKKQFQEAMTKEEKEKLFKAIDYQENLGDINYPKEFIDIHLNFFLESLIIEVNDDKLDKPKVMHLDLKQVNLECNQRPTGNGLKIHVTVFGFAISGLEQKGVFPQLCQCLDHHLGSNIPFIDFLLDMNPLDNSCDTAIEIELRPLRIIYDAQTIIKLIDIFTPEEDKSALVYQLQLAANMKFAEMKEKSALGLQYTIQKHSRLKLRINVMASHIILPNKGFYLEDEPLVVYNLGRLTIESKEEINRPSIKSMHVSGANEQEILEVMQAGSYDKFAVKIENMQMVLARPGEDWMEEIKNPTNPELYLLHPTSLYIEIHKCLITDDPRLPKIKIIGTLPKITLKIQESRLFDTIVLLLSIPFSEKRTKLGADEIVPSGLTMYGSSSSLFWFEKDADKSRMEKKRNKTVTGVFGGNEELLQFTDLDAQFHLNEIIVEIISDRELASTEPFLTFKVMKLEGKMLLQTYNMSVNLNLGGLSLTQLFEPLQTIKVIDTPMASGENEDLFVLKYINVDKKCPDFHTKHKSVIQLIEVEFSKVNILVHQDALLFILHWLNNLQAFIAKAQKIEPVPSVSTKTLHPVMSRSSKEAVASSFKIGGKKGRKKPVEAIDLKLKAQLGEIGITLANQYFSLAKMDIAGATGSILIKRSYTQIDAKLIDLQVIDLKNSVHPKIISILGKEELITFQLVIFNEELQNKKESVNMALTAKIACVRVVFLNRFVSSVLNFMNNFQLAQEALIEASAAAAEAAKMNMQHAYTAALKIRLNIVLHAPIVVIPVNSLSYDAILVDFGKLTIKNSFQDISINDKDRQNYTAVLDRISLSLDNVKVLRIVVNDVSFDPIKTILEPISFQLHVKRNLSASWFTEEPDLDVSAHFQTIKINLHKDDYYMVMNILGSNFGEEDGSLQSKDSANRIQSKQPSIKSFKPTTSEKFIEFDETDEDKFMKKGLSTRSIPGVEVTTFLKFTFRLESLIIQLSYNEFNPRSSIKSETVTEVGLAKLEIFLLSLKGAIHSDGTYVASALLLNFLIDDTRPTQQSKINRYMERIPVKGQLSKLGSQSDIAKSSTNKRSMIDATFKMKDGSMFIDFRVFSFMMILNLQHLLKLAEFFTIDSEPKSNTNVLGEARQQSLSSTSSRDAVILQKKLDLDRAAKVEPTKTEIVVKLSIEKPDIILVESLDDINTNALILEMEALMELRMVNTIQQVVTGTIKSIQMFTCCYNPLRREDTKFPVLRPFSVNITGCTPNIPGNHLEISTTNIHLSFSPGTIELLNTCYNVLYSNITETHKYLDEDMDYSDVWNISPVEESDYWFLKSEEASDALEMLKSAPLKTTLNEDNPEMNQIDSEDKSEICMISIPSIVITMEAGIGNYTLPMLLLESSIKGTASNWSSNLTADMQVTLQMGYYNSRLAMWEPLIEPIEVIKNNSQIVSPWQLSVMLETHPISESNTSICEDSVDGVALNRPPLMIVNITSQEMMELTISKTCLEVLNSLGTSFNEAIYKPETQAVVDRAPYIVQNYTGLDVVLLLNQMPFQVYKKAVGEKIREVLVKPGAEVGLCAIGHDTTADVSSLMLSNTSLAPSAEKYITISVDGASCILDIPVSRAEKRYFILKPKLENREQQSIISDVSVKDGSVYIALCGTIRVYNHFHQEISVYFMTHKGNEVELVNSIPAEGHLNLPVNAIYTPTYELFFSVPNYSISLSPFVWKDLEKMVKMSAFLQCNSKNLEDKEPFFIQVMGEMEQVFYELTSHYTIASTCYNIHLRPTVIIKNFLPVEIMICIQGNPSEKYLESGGRTEIPTAEPGKSSIVIRISGYLDKDWSCKHVISENPPELEVWTFESYDAPQKFTFDLGMHSMNKNGSMIMELYCPFWMINKTGLSLSYRHSDDLSNILYHPENFKHPIMFSFRAKNFFGKKKACIKVLNGEWSEKFSLDVAGSFGMVSCKVKDEVFQIGVHIELTYNTLTKQVIFTPYYILVNHCCRPIDCSEAVNTNWIKVEAESCEPYYPLGYEKNMVVQISGTTEKSVEFPYDMMHNSLLKLDNKFGGINVDVHMTESAVYISLSDFKEELAPALLINNTQMEIDIGEKYGDLSFTLPPFKKKLFCWSSVKEGSQLTWINGKYTKHLHKDDIGEFHFPDSTKAYYVSFLDGMQRVLLFTSDPLVAKEAQNAGDFQQFDQELIISIHGIGLSLVDNINLCEILYLGITSSGIIWESASKVGSKRYKPIDHHMTEVLEEYYQIYINEKQLGYNNPKRTLPGKIEVDFENEMISKPTIKPIKRKYNTGFWLNMKTSNSQVQLHAKVNRLQIDNQMYDCVFPVVLAPVPPPKSVVNNLEVAKPFAEVSIVQRLNQHTTVKQYKYFKVLIQEFHIKVDIGFINALVNFFEAGEISDALEVSQFTLDCKLVEKELMAHVSILSSQQQKNFYDFLHFSPLKIHISFSLSSGGANGGITGLPPVISVLTQSLGVTLTDMQDVVFKLSYFERQYTFLNQRQLINEVQMHYTGQFFKQFYVLVFGLDVLGNPYGLVVGLKQGVEDLFYEPFQGAIQGPGEFAEGVYLGVRSLFGHTIGGAAGAMSRITGAMGKGLAALTLDEDYQKKRREQLHAAQTSNVQESMALSGKGLVMGVVHGIGGVFTKPLSGAKEEGVEGFFKGFGKGMVGLVTRPTAGFVDFASGTFSSVRRITQFSEEVSRIRNPRYFNRDRLVRPYSKPEADGQKLLMEVDKGKLHSTDVYVYHLSMGHKDILLLTDNRIAYLARNDVFGTHQIDWSFTWGEFSEPPTLVDNGVLISINQSKKKLFKSSSSKKLLLISNPQQQQMVFKKIQECLAAHSAAQASLARRNTLTELST